MTIQLTLYDIMYQKYESEQSKLEEYSVGEE